MSAETFINRASLLVTDETDGALKLQHKVCYARILDAKRKFIEVCRAARQRVRVRSCSCASLAGAGGDALLPALAAVIEAVRREDRLRGRAHHGAADGGHVRPATTRLDTHLPNGNVCWPPSSIHPCQVRDSRPCWATTLAPPRHAVQGRALL